MLILLVWSLEAFGCHSCTAKSKSKVKSGELDTFMELVDMAKIDFSMQQKLSRRQGNICIFIINQQQHHHHHHCQQQQPKKTTQEQLKSRRIHRYHRQQYSNGGSGWTKTEG